MINPQLLRIGNTLQYANDERLKEDRIGKLFHITMEDLIYFHRNLVDYVVYAPLSEAILLEAGFTKEGSIFSKEGLSIEGKGDKFVFTHKTGATTIYYIHQLENLYFSVMGEELEIIIKK